MEYGIVLLGCIRIVGIPPWGSVAAGRLDTISRIR
jgi:hypothetical protein